LQDNLFSLINFFTRAECGVPYFEADTLKTIARDSLLVGEIDVHAIERWLGKKRDTIKQRSLPTKQENRESNNC